HLLPVSDTCGSPLETMELEVLRSQSRVGDQMLHPHVLKSGFVGVVPRPGWDSWREADTGASLQRRPSGSGAADRAGERHGGGGCTPCQQPVYRRPHGCRRRWGAPRPVTTPWHYLDIRALMRGSSP